MEDARGGSTPDPPAGEGGTAKLSPRSEKRQRNRTLTVRFNAQEWAALEETAERTGYSRGYLIRRALFAEPPPRARPRPSLDTKLLAGLLAQMGKIGSNLNQLAKYAHLGRTQSAQIETALHELLELRLACMQALGYEKPAPTQGSDNPQEPSEAP